jgi:DNA-binding MarR family transcriptional regulator
VSTIDPSEELPPLGPALELMRRLWRVSHEYERLSGRMSASLGLTAQQRTTLRIIGRFPHVTAGRLSTMLCVDAATVSIALGRLESRGLIRRSRDPVDGRRVVIALTARGRKLDAPARGTVESAVERALASIDDRDLRAVGRVLDVLATSFEAELARDAQHPETAPKRRRRTA